MKYVKYEYDFFHYIPSLIKLYTRFVQVID